MDAFGCVQAEVGGLAPSCVMSLNILTNLFGLVSVSAAERTTH
jgi:hypothetical protein